MNQNISNYLDDQITIRRLKLDRIYLISLAVYLILVIAFLVWQTRPEIPSIISSPVVSEPELINKCSNLDMFETAECLRGELIKFYFYNISNTEKELTDEELKNSGGVCRHYADWYRNRFISLGAELSEEGDIYYFEKNSSKFYVKEIIIPMTNDSSHVFTVVSSSKGWCALDMEDVVCLKRGFQ
jgi:hypothetical protein